MLLNLAGNAVKFTERGEIAVRVAKRPAEAGLAQPHLLIEVQDTGIGIPEERLATIFEPFRQADESTTRRFGGSGLGTTIARDLTRLMGGEIYVTSQEGQGTCFSVRLPLPEAQAAPAAQPAPELAGRRAIVYERNAHARALIGEILAGAGILCVPIDDPATLEHSAVEAANLLILADAPEPVDLAAIRARLRCITGLATPCLGLTYTGRRVTRAVAACDATLHKPFLGDELLAAVERLIHFQAPGNAVEAAERSSAPAAPETESQPPPSPQARVLVAEDNEIAAKVITTFIARLGCTVVRVEDGEAALREAQQGGFDIAFIDLRMPKLDGLAFTRAWRRAEHRGHLPIIALTADAAEEVKADCLAAGMDGFLSKPVKADALRQIIIEKVTG